MCVGTQDNFTSGQELGIKDGVSYTQLAETFVASENKNISTIQAYLLKVGSPGDSETITAEIWSNNSGTGQPNALLTSGSTTLANISAAGSFVPITTSAYSLVSGTTYWLILKASYIPSTSNLVKWARTNGTTDSYTSGQAYYINGGSYQTAGANRDFAFRVGGC